MQTDVNITPANALWSFYMSPQETLLFVMAGSAIFTVGLLTLCAHFASALSRERILLWFGLFAAPYGLALILRSVLIAEWDARVDQVVVIVGRLIGLASSIPALLLFRQFYGKGWRLSSKWLIWAYAFAARHNIGYPCSLGAARRSACRLPSSADQRSAGNLLGTIDIFPDVLLRPSIPFVDGWRSGSVGAVRVPHSDDIPDS
jgi:hypothetical protein